MSTSSKATVESTEFHQNYADNYGAGVNMDGSSRLTCTQCNISRNLDTGENLNLIALMEVSTSPHILKYVSRDCFKAPRFAIASACCNCRAATRAALLPSNLVDELPPTGFSLVSTFTTRFCAACWSYEIVPAGAAEGFRGWADGAGAAGVEGCGGDGDGGLGLKLGDAGTILDLAFMEYAAIKHKRDPKRQGST